MSKFKQFMWVQVTMPDLQEHLKGKEFKLERWPDFGSCDYIPGYIEMSALLSRGYQSLEALKGYSNLEIKEVNHFLNSASLQGLLQTRDESKNGQNSLRRRHDHGFMAKLKKLVFSTYQRSHVY